MALHFLVPMLSFVVHGLDLQFAGSNFLIRLRQTLVASNELESHHTSVKIIEELVVVSFLLLLMFLALS